MRDGTREISVKLVLRSPGQGGFSIERVVRSFSEALPPDISAEVVHLPAHGASARALVRNIRFVRRLDADVVHVTGDATYAILGLPQAARVITIHDLVSVHRLRGVKRWVLLLLWYWLPVRVSDHVTAISEFSLDELRYSLSRLRVSGSVVPNPLDPSFLAPSSQPMRQPARILLVGVSANKNLLQVVKALSSLEVELRIIGDPTPELRVALIYAESRFSVCSNLTDAELAHEYMAATCLVFASLYEGFGLPILEAQSMGCPVITSDIEPLRSVAGDAAILVDPSDPIQIREAVERVLADEDYREGLAQRGFNNIQRFSAERIAGLYAEIYRRVAST